MRKTLGVLALIAALTTFLACEPSGPSHQELEALLLEALDKAGKAQEVYDRCPHIQTEVNSKFQVASSNILQKDLDEDAVLEFVGLVDFIDAYVMQRAREDDCL